jgi:hypothetical protein
MGLQIKEKWAKFAIVSRKLYNDNEYINLGTYHFEIVKNYTYFGKTPTNKKELTPEIEKGNMNANRAYDALLPELKRKSVLTAEKIKI